MENFKELLRSVENYFENPKDPRHRYRTQLAELTCTTLQNIMKQPYREKLFYKELIRVFNYLAEVFPDHRIFITSEEEQSALEIFVASCRISYVHFLTEKNISKIWSYGLPSEIKNDVIEMNTAQIKILGAAAEDIGYRALGYF